MAEIPMDPELAARVAAFLEGLTALSKELGIVIAFINGQEYLETPDGDSLPLRINRANGSYVLEAGYV